MKVRKTIKSIFALGAGLTMLGATVFGAMAAADLGAYPSQYITAGKFDGLMVVGSNAKTEDVLGIVDIATSLQFAAKIEKPVSGGTTTTVEGDSYLISSNANELELGETLADIKSTIDAQSGLGVLETGSIRTSKGSTDVKQYLKLGGSQLTAVYESNSEVDPNVVGPFVKADSGDELFTYEVQFSDNLESDLDDNDKLEDVEDEDVVMLGKVFSIVESELTGDEEFTMTLMGGALTDTLKEGESKTYEVGGKKYEVSVLIIADSNDATAAKVKLMINGEVTNSLEDGETDTLDDGTVIGIRDVLANEGAETNGGDIVAFYIGANKLILDGGDNSVEVDEETVEDVNVSITGTNSTTDASISKITFVTVASDTTYLEDGKKLSTYLDEAAAMVSDQWDIMFAGLTQPGTSEVKVRPSGNDKYYLDFTSQDGYEYSLLLLDRESAGTVNIGKENGDELEFTENSTIEEDDVFVVGKDSADFDANTHVLSLTDINAADNEITLKEEASGNSATYKLKYATTNATISGTDTRLVSATTTALTVGGDDYNVWVDAAAGGGAPNWILVDLDGDGSIGAGEWATIVAKGGLMLNAMTLDVGTGADAEVVGSLNFTIDPDLEQDGDTAASNPVNVTITTADTKELDLTIDLGTGTTSSDEDSDDEKGMNQYGILVERKDSEDGADTATLTVPNDQVFYQVYIVGNDVKTSSTAQGKTISEYQKIEVGAAVLDSEISSVSADNLIVVGGPCANTISASLLGISSSMPACYENFPVNEGQGIIKMVMNGQKVATVVAGYSAADTRKAAQVLANYEANAVSLKGKSEVVVSGSKISAPEVVAEEEPAAEEEEEAAE